MPFRVAGNEADRYGIMAKRKTVGLIAFLKGSSNPENKMPGCCNYDHNSGGCLGKDSCFVEQGKRCGYFEKVVLPTSADLGLKELIYSLYQKHVGIAEDDSLISTTNIRPCPDCSKKRRQATYRKSRQKK